MTKDLHVQRLSMQAQGAVASYSGAGETNSALAGPLVSEYVPLLQGDTLLLSADPQSDIELYINPGSANVVLLLFYN